jgi:hypothetical protein
MDTHLYNSLTEGDFGNGLLLRQNLAEGEFWTLPNGCVAVYRGEDSVAKIDYERIAAVGFSQGLLQMAASFQHAPNSETFYAARRISGTGKQEFNSGVLVRVALDAEGKLRPAKPNRVQRMWARQIEGGRIRISWWFWPMGQEAAPVWFYIYHNNGNGQVDYENSVGKVKYNGKYFHFYETETLEEGKTYQFGVRAVTAAGVDDGNTAVVEATVDMTGPAAATMVRVGRRM